jgi:formylglycine-generating enzyme required for sulfatase activity
MQSKGIWLVAVVSAAALAAGLLGGAGQPPSELEKQIHSLIERLGDDSYAEREAAGKELEELSDQALPALRKEVDNTDSEIRLRARQLIRTINLQLRTSKTTGLEMVAIEPGQFTMGSPEGEAGRQVDEAQHRVRLTKPFLLGIYEVTQDQYLQVMENKPSWFAPTGGGKDRVIGKDTSKFPVENVTWYDAIDFCNRLSKRDGFEPYYELTVTKKELNSIAEGSVKMLGGKGYRLPTEAEWEYACRAGSTGPFWFGVENTGKEANLKPVMVPGGYGEVAKWPYQALTMPVGSFPANKFGLHDMHGNVGEWCWDLYDKDYYARSPQDDPQGPDAGVQRVERGGSWMVLEGNSRSAARIGHTPDQRKNYSGFRVARNPQ